ncbi:MAG: type 4a pilus biogenesis protein PilO [Candidatus Pacebacteria bacterium]|nr:type 4a pilus biogenesis protein PilO [Candidatus Paceibacterota bacterium]
MIRNFFTILFLGGALAIFFLYTSPAYDTVQALSAQSAQYNAALTKAAQLQQLKQSLLSRYNSFDQGALNRLSTMLPDQVDNIRLILDLDNLAGRYGMALQNVQISSTATQGSNVVGSIASGAQPYNSLTIQFTTHGTYSQFKEFLAALQSSLRLVDLESLTFQPGGSTSGTSNDPQYSYSLGLQTYWLH